MGTAECTNDNGFNANDYGDGGLLTEGKEYGVLNMRESLDPSSNQKYSEIQIVADNGETRWFEAYRFN